VADVEVVLDDGVAGPVVDPLRARLAIPSGEAEHAGAADHGHLPDGPLGGVGAQDGEAAAVVGAVDEDKVHGHHQRQRVPAGAHVHALRAADQPGGRQVGALGERVVDDDDGAEARGGGVGRGGLGHLDYRGHVRAPGHHVVPEHAQVRLLLLRRRGGGQQGERQEAGGQGCVAAGGGHGYMRSCGRGGVELFLTIVALSSVCCSYERGVRGAGCARRIQLFIYWRAAGVHPSMHGGCLVGFVRVVQHVD
jgi:hypothetical protein